MWCVGFADLVAYRIIGGIGIGIVSIMIVCLVAIGLMFQCHVKGLAYLAIMRFLVPDTTGKSLEEIERFWA